MYGKLCIFNSQQDRCNFGVFCAHCNLNSVYLLEILHLSPQKINPFPETLSRPALFHLFVLFVSTICSSQ